LRQRFVGCRGSGYRRRAAFNRHESHQHRIQPLLGVADAFAEQTDGLLLGKADSQVCRDTLAAACWGGFQDYRTEREGRKVR
jgi:hypothetical protein